MSIDRFKFRIWHDAQGMIYPDDTFIRVSQDKVMKLDPSIEEPRYFIMPLQDYDIMQCTGLKDVEGKLIYEGDLVMLKHWKSADLFNYSKPFEVCWEYGQVNFKQGDYNNFIGSLVGKLDIKIIGNIYETV